MDAVLTISFGLPFINCNDMYGLYEVVFLDPTYSKIPSWLFVIMYRLICNIVQEGKGGSQAHDPPDFSLSEVSESS